MYEELFNLMGFWGFGVLGFWGSGSIQRTNDKYGHELLEHELSPHLGTIRACRYGR